MRKRSFRRQRALCWLTSTHAPRTTTYESRAKSRRRFRQGSMDNAPQVTPSHQVGGYHEFAPPPDLSDAVEALWIHQAADVKVVPHRVVPDAAVSLCFMGRRAPDGSIGDARLRIIGPVIQPQTFAPPAGHRM